MSSPALKKISLSQLPLGAKAQIVEIRPTASGGTHRLMELGFLEGAWCQKMHEAPFYGDPIAVRVRGTLVALRRAEASSIQVLFSG